MVVSRINIRPSDVGNGIVYLILSDFIEEQIGLLADTLTVLRNQVANIRGNLILEIAPLGLKNLMDVWGGVGKKSQLMTQIKSELDPTNVLNPGRFVAGI